MSEATREHVIDKSRQVIQAYTDRIKSSENYIDYFPIEGKTLINNYSNNIEKQSKRKFNLRIHLYGHFLLV